MVFRPLRSEPAAGRKGLGRPSRRELRVPNPRSGALLVFPTSSRWRRPPRSPNDEVSPPRSSPRISFSSHPTVRSPAPSRRSAGDGPGRVRHACNAPLRRWRVCPTRRHLGTFWVFGWFGRQIGVLGGQNEEEREKTDFSRRRVHSTRHPSMSAGGFRRLMVRFQNHPSPPLFYG